MSKFRGKQSVFGYFSDDFPRNPLGFQGKYPKSKKRTSVLDNNIQNPLIFLGFWTFMPQRAEREYLSSISAKSQEKFSIARNLKTIFALKPDRKIKI